MVALIFLFLMKNMSKYQIGTKKGHRAEEHIFVVTSYMAMCEMYKKKRNTPAKGFNIHTYAHQHEHEIMNF